MEKIPEIVESWLAAGEQVALARVVSTWGSSPRPIGSVMVISSSGSIAGSVSGGCVETSVAKKAMVVLETGKSVRVNYGVSNEDAWSVGLSCGGKLDVFIQKMNHESSPVWQRLLQLQKQNLGATVITCLTEEADGNVLLTNEDQHGGSVSETLVSAAKEAYQLRTHRFVDEENRSFFIQVFPRKPQLIVVGAAHITVDLVALAHQYGFETIVIDPRGYFTANTTFSTPPDQLLEAYPSDVLSDFSLDAYTFCAILSHDPKIDDDALQVLLNSDVAYIGALGSRKNQARRAVRLQEMGFTEDAIEQIHGPIGADIHARSAGEIALSIMAEIIHVKNMHLIR